MTRLIARGINAILLVALLTASVLWVWSGHNSSLGFVLSQLPGVLDQAKGLRATSVDASVRHGGTIGELTWQADGLSIRAREVSIRYDLNTLLQRRLDTVAVTIGQLHIIDKSAKSEPVALPEQLMLPLPISVSIKVDELLWQNIKSPVVTQLSFDYSFEQGLHRLQAGQAQIAAASYKFQAELGATQPLALKASAQGIVQANIPGSAAPHSIQALAKLDGELGHRDSTLNLNVELSPGAPAGAAAKDQTTIRARLAATVAPWQSQPLTQVRAEWTSLDLALFWPEAPHTLLSGQAEIKPAGAPQSMQWDARVALRNQGEGPWDRKRLPLTALTTSFRYQDDAWLIKDLQADMGRGTVQASGRYIAQAWQLEATLEQVMPSELDSRLSGGAVTAQVQAERGAKGLAFDTEWRAASPLSARLDPAWPLTLDSLRAVGTWQSAVLTLDQLDLKANSARITGALSYDSGSHATQGDFILDGPGLRLKASGQAAADKGQGQFQLDTRDAQRTAAWLAQLPAFRELFAPGKPQGSLAIKGSWDGGWSNWQKSLKVDLDLQGKNLQWSSTKEGAASDLPLLQNLQLRAAGLTSQLSIQSEGQAQLGQQQLSWTLAGGAESKGPDLWHATFQQVRMRYLPSAQAKPWLIDVGGLSSSTSEPLRLVWRHTNGPGEWSMAPAQALVRGSVPGEIKLIMDETRLNSSTSGSLRWRSSGRVQNLPISWLEAASPKTLKDLGLTSDLMLLGRWEAEQSQWLHVQAVFERDGGDLRLVTDDPRQPEMPAKLRELKLQVDLNDQQVAGSFRWDSAGAGSALIAASTTLTDSPTGWRWADDAPVAAGIQLQSPPAQAWNAFAPPGWRIQGIVDANITLAGTRGAPQWAGKVRARDLAVRSLVQGLDFEQGYLLANLDGQTLTIDDAAIKGGGGGGQVKLKGKLDWVTDSSVRAVASHLRMDVSAQLQSLRVSVRPDRRVSASGQLRANFNGEALRLSGALVADNALITLPDESAPTLGDDVIVRRPAAAQSASLLKPAPKTAPPALPFQLEVSLDPGPDFQIRGRGLQGRLAGQLTLHSSGPGTTQLNGKLSTVGGQYTVLGQKLDIEKGVLLFAGVIDNPTLDILAIRPQLPTKVGIQVTGKALTPAVRLYSDPELPEAQKLSWLLIGRASGGSGAEAALIQQATLALLTGRDKTLPTTRLAQAFGLDELNVQGKSSTAGGEIDSASLSLGKRLSKDVYVAYEHSLAGTMSAFSIFYDLSSRLTVRAQAGEKSAIDLIYNLRYD